MRIFLLCLALCPLISLAQRSKPPISYHTAITVSPLALMQVDPTIMAGVEYRVLTNLVVATEAGYVFESGYLLNNSFDKRNIGISGFTIRPSIKLFMNERQSFYLQPQLLYKQVTHRRHDWLGREVVNGVPAYEELVDFKYRRAVYGVNAICGVLVPLSRRNRTMFDFYLGFGVRRKTGHVLNEPNSGYRTETLIGNTSTADDGTFPSLPGGLRILIAL